MNKILVLTDFSEISKAASHYAMQLADMVNAELHFLHVINTPVDWMALSREDNMSSPQVRFQAEKAEEQLHELTREAKQMGLPSRFYIAYNRPYFDFTDHINTCSYYDFTIMGSHGASGFKELFVGSNAQKVIRHSRCPVLVIKKMPKRIVPRQIVFISSFQKRDQNAFLRVLTLAHIFSAEINLLYVKSSNQKENLQDVETRIQTFFQKVIKKPMGYHIEMDKEGEEGVMEYIGRNHTELIAVSTEGRTGLSRIVKPSFAESLVNHAPIPVLSILKRE